MSTQKKFPTKKIQSDADRSGRPDKEIARRYQFC